MGFISILIVQMQTSFPWTPSIPGSPTWEVVMSKDNCVGDGGSGGDCGSGECTAIWGQYSSAVAVKWSHLSTESNNFVWDLQVLNALKTKPKHTAIQIK